MADAGGLLSRWQALWDRLGGVSPPGPEDILEAWAGPQRHYHDTIHLADVLEKLDWGRRALEETGELSKLSDIEKRRLFYTVELALWYHDAIYDPKAKDNEARSRDWLLKDAAKAGLDEGLAHAAARLVELTACHGKAATLAEKIMSDCDLAILGAVPAVFEVYDKNIRREYSHVPEPVYRIARAKVLEGFLGEDSLFKTRAFQSRFGAQARQNLEQALRRKPLWFRLFSRRRDKPASP